MSPPNPSPYAPPAGLTAGSEALWRALVPQRAKSPGRLALLEEWLRARDRASEFRALLAQQELISTTKTTGVVRLNPLIKAEREALALFTKLGKALTMEWDMNIDGRG